MIKISLRVRSIIAGIFLLAVACDEDDDRSKASINEVNEVNDVTTLNPIWVGDVIEPRSVADVVKALQATSGPVSVGGGRFSQGGQVAYRGSLHFDMRKMDQVINFQPDAREITVQAGITWRKIQEVIDQKDLSIQIMQTYSNFTVGGSLSVNVHGRYIGKGPLVSSIKSFKIVLADGTVVDASPLLQPEIFYGAIGGYGGLGVIVEVKLALDENVKVRRQRQQMPLSAYRDFFFKEVRSNPAVVFHNADIYPPDYQDISAVSWLKTNQPVTVNERLIATDSEYEWQPKMVGFVAGSTFGKWLRQHIFDPLLYSFERVEWRNYEASYDARELEPGNRKETTYVLREYFVPVERFDEFYPLLRATFQKYDVKVVNISIRHAFKDPGTLLAWAKSEVFAFVVYYQQGTSPEAKEVVKNWTIDMVNAVLSVGGSYYLPYQVFNTNAQFLQAYPKAPEFFALKSRLDPENRFINQLWDAYYPANQTPLMRKAREIKQYYRGEEQTFLTLPEWYLVFNPKEYAEYLGAQKPASDFPYFASIEEYWNLYEKVTDLTKDIYPANDEYMTMLKVIGVSTTIEYAIKGIYENTIGRLTSWMADHELTQEDQLMASAHHAYSDFIYQNAWYEFDFFSWVRRLWQQTDIMGHNFIRKVERRIFFTVEFLIKAVYAKLIGFGAKTAYEESDGQIYAKVRAPTQNAIAVDKRIRILAAEADLYLISLPRWGGFSEVMPLLANANIDFLDISGNDDIALSLLVDSKEEFKSAYGQLVINSKVVSDPSKTRWVLKSKVRDLAARLRLLTQNFNGVEHIYDY